MAKLTVVSWREQDASQVEDPLNWWGGFFERGMRWNDYVEEFDDELVPYLEAARHSAVENGLKTTGSQHQQHGIKPVFSDGKCLSLTMRAWGDFMAAVWSDQDDTDFSYMDFYT